jgi:REP element-mobilizing transposase RayT
LNYAAACGFAGELAMARPIIIAHHLIWTAYGWWLPNDPRGSGSQQVIGRLIAELGKLYKGRKQVQPSGHEVRQFYERAVSILRFPLLRVTGPALVEAGSAFAEVVKTERYTCYACAIMPDHVHLLIRKHKHTAEQMMEAFKSASRERLAVANIRTTDHPTWGDGGWKVFLDHPDEIWRTITYIEDNPLPWNMPRQVWPFVTKYDGWPLHPGHSPNSPYAKLLKAVGRYPGEAASGKDE